MTIEDIHLSLANLINIYIRKEFVAQGHHLTGALEESIENKFIKNAKSDIISGYAIHYAKIIEEGLAPSKISWKMLPGLVRYFSLRGLGAEESKKAAFFTIRKWMVEGLSTEASKVYSSTGQRHGFIEEAFKKNEPAIDGFMNSTLDFAVDELYRKTKSEIV